MCKIGPFPKGSYRDALVPTLSNAAGYQLQHAANSSFTSAKTVTVTGASTLSKTVASLTKGNTYYVRVRAYQTVSGVNDRSAWSAAKSVKIAA